MPRPGKKSRYASFNAADNSFGFHTTPVELWSSYLDPTKKLTLELGCGKAEVSVELASRNSDENFIGIDLKADRLERAVRQGRQRDICNLALINMDIKQLAEVFKGNSVSTIWITFCDPYPKNSHAIHRLTHNNFLDIYKEVLTTNGLVKFKTDNVDLFEWTQKVLTNRDDIKVLEVSDDTEKSYESDHEINILTTFEKRFREEGITTKYLAFQFI